MHIYHHVHIILGFIEDDGSDDDRLRCLTDSLIARLDSVQWPSSCRDNGSISGLEAEHSD